MDKANQPIPLGEMRIEFIIDGRSIGTPAKAVLNLFPNPHVVFEVSDVPRNPWSVEPAAQCPKVTVRSAPVTSEGPSAITLENGIPLNVVPLSWMATQSKGSFHPTQSPCVVLQTDSPIRSMRFGVLNFSGSGGNQSLFLQAPPWSVRIEPASNLRELERTLRVDHGYAITHQGIISRTDEKTYSAEEAGDLLDALDHFLSFVCGSCCSLATVTGFDSEGNEAWKRWGSHHVSPWRCCRSWFDITVSGALVDMFPVFWAKFIANKKDLCRAVDLYVGANEAEVIDVSLILTQAALELLSYLTVGSKSGRKTGQWIADSLGNAGICHRIPIGFKALEALRKREGCHHGPHTIVQLRNSVTHAEMICGPVSLDAFYQARCLGLWYLELLLLNFFKYRGEYASRLDPVQRAGVTKPVPWGQGGTSKP